MTFVKDLDTPLLRLSADDVYSLRDACSGLHAFGGIGAGKTSALEVLAGAQIRAGMGGYVTSIKPDNIPLWKGYLAKHGSSKSLVLLDETECFNFLDYELGRHGMDGISTVVEALMRILDASKRTDPTASQRGGDAFWSDSTRQCLRYTIPPLYAANGSVSIADIIRFINTAPLKDPSDREWQKRSFMYEAMHAAEQSPKVAMPSDMQRNCIHFWEEEYPAIPDKTRGNIVISITSALDRFKHGRLNRAFCGKTTAVPELSFGGAVLVEGKPTLTWNEDGIIAQQIFKYFWQRAVLNRNSLAEKHRERPVFLWCDEAQETVHPFDGEFLSLCRQSKCCMTYITQSLPNYYAKMGGDNPRDAAHTLAGKFVTNLFFSNACPETNEYASRVIGKVLKRRANYSTGKSKSMNIGMSSGSSENTGTSSNYGSSSSYTLGTSGGTNQSSNSGDGYNRGTGSNWGSTKGRGTSENESRGYSETMEFAFEPGDFARDFKTGGPANGGIVTGVWFQGGRVFKSSGSNFLVEAFRQ